MRAGRLIRRAAELACLAAFVVPNAAVAQGCTPQQKVAALDQYCNALPTSEGKPAPIGAARELGPRLMHALPAKEVEQLRAAGPAARALLLLSAAAPVGRDRAATRRRRATPGAARRVVASGALERKSPVTVVASTLATASSDVVAGAFRWGLVFSTLGLVGLAWVRFRGQLKL